MRSSNSQPAGASGRMEVDPEVAALLDDLPRTRLPEELVEQGWGHASMDEMVKYGQYPPAPPSLVPAPTFDENCAQCGRPIALKQRGTRWMDHAGRTECDSLLVDDPQSGHHITESDLTFLRAANEDLLGPKRKTVNVLHNCSATKYSHGCAHYCDHKEQHFGFHECKFCKKLWK